MKFLVSRYAKYVIIAAISFTIGALVPLTAEIKRNPVEQPLQKSKPYNSIQKFSKADQNRVIEIFKVWKLSSELGLTDAQLASFLPKYKQLESARSKFWDERRKTINELKVLMQNDKKSEEQVKAILNKLRDLRLNFANNINITEDELTKGLSVEQQANFVILNDSFRQEIRQLTEKLKSLDKEETQLSQNR